MDAETLFYAFLSIALGFAFLGLVIYIHLKSASTRVVRSFFMVVLFFAFSAIFSGLMLVDADKDTALMLARMSGFCFVMSFSSFLYLAIILKDGESIETQLPMNIFFALFALVGIFAGYLLDDIESVSEGWWFEGPGSSYMISVITSLIIVTSIILYQQFKRAVNENQRKQLKLLIFAVMSPIIIGISMASLLILGIGVPQITYPIESLGVLLALTYAVSKYHLIIVRPVKESNVCPVFVRPVADSIMGKSYIIESKNCVTAYTVLKEEIDRGARGLIVSREHPDRVKEKYALSNINIIWLTNIPGKDHIDPSNISIIERFISEPIRGTVRTIVLLDGIEELILHNKEEKVLQTLFNLRDEFITSTGTFLLNVDPMTLDEKVLAMLEKDFEVLQDAERTSK